jgi:hypothetical protein
MRSGHNLASRLGGCWQGIRENQAQAENRLRLLVKGTTDGAVRWSRAVLGRCAILINRESKRADFALSAPLLGRSMKDQDKRGVGRRDFLNVLGIAAGAFAAGAPFAGAAFADTESNDEKRKPRYRESEEVRTFYRVNRYPS